MYIELYRNLPGNPDWEGSFYEKLTEEGIWCVDEFWKFHLDLVKIARCTAQSLTVDKEVALTLVTLYSRINKLICAHHNVNDAFKIENLTTDELLDFSERLEHAMIAIFSGDVLPETSYGAVNPYIVSR